MLSKNKIFSYIFLFSFFPGLFLSFVYVKFIDELIYMLLLGIVFLDCVVNGYSSVKRMKPLWIVSGIMLFYVFYSIIFLNYNTPYYILEDFVIQIKPFVPLFVVSCLHLEFREELRPFAKILCIANVFTMVFFYVWGNGEVMLPFGHITSLGAICMISSYTYLYMSLDNEGKVSWKDLTLSILFLSVGLLCGRSKYYGQYVISLFLFFNYRQGLLRKITIKHILVGFVLFCLVIFVAWKKIHFYFIQGIADMLQNGSTEAYNDSFARPMLFLVGGQILIDHFPFGSGLASFASFSSSENYSSLYYEYGLDKVWGLGPNDPYNFICDAYYPTLSQFGIIGISLFVYYWRWIIIKLNNREDVFGQRYHYYYIIGILIITFILIESVGGTTFIVSSGMHLMMLLGLLISEKD